MKSSSNWAWVAPIVLYAASALEMIIMVTPFAAYFYSVYTPLFHGLEQSIATAWLPQFFLPHLAHTKFALFRGFNWLGALLALVGIIGFFVCAIQLYYGKFIRKQLVSGGLYARVRHPQYLMLIIGGAGFLLLWPRFFILATYLMMLGLYYMLARHEEQTIKNRYGGVSDDYLARVPMLNPFRGPRKTGTFKPIPRAKAIRIWFAIVTVSMILAFGLRTIAVSQLYAVQWEPPLPNVTGLAFRAMSDDAIEETMASVMATPAVQMLQQESPDTPLFLQINDGSSQLRHLLIDLGMTSAALDALDTPKDGFFIVVSRVVPRDPERVTPPDVISLNPFSLSARIEPAILIGPPDGADRPSSHSLTADQFYQSFARILF